MKTLGIIAGALLAYWYLFIYNVTAAAPANTATVPAGSATTVQNSVQGVNNFAPGGIASGTSEDPGGHQGPPGGNAGPGLGITTASGNPLPVKNYLGTSPTDTVPVGILAVPQNEMLRVTSARLFALGTPVTT